MRLCCVHAVNRQLMISERQSEKMIHLQSKGLDVQQPTNKATHSDFPLLNKNAAVSVSCTPVRGKKRTEKNVC